MLEYKQLLRNKKMKILILAVLLCFLGLIKESISIQLTYILKQKQDYVEPNCIAEGDMLSSAVGWIYPMPQTKEDIPHIKTFFVPTINSDYNCNFEKGHVCNSLWRTHKWKLDKNYDLLLDTRWEEFPTLLTTNKSAEIRNEIPPNFNIGFSLRAAGNVELFLCEGWNYTTYPCYYINIGEDSSIYLKKYKVYQDLKSNTQKLDKYHYYANILYEHEWRNFELGFDKNNTLTFKEMFTNKTILSYTDKKPLNLLYFFIKSKDNALWKINNNQYLYTTEETLEDFGPLLKMESSNDFCVSLYLKQCDNCKIKFFLKQKNITSVLKEVYNASSEWIYVVLNATNVYEEFVQLQIETKFVHENATKSNAFWAIDEIRVCSKNEIKVSRVISNKIMNSVDEDSDAISCHSLAHQKYRPVKHVQPLLNVFPGIQANASSTSVMLSWNSYPVVVPSLSYLISYQGMDICDNGKETNKLRTKSSGHVITKEHEITLEQLVPYTNYIVQFSFVLNENHKDVTVNTLPTEVLTEKELPTNINITSSDTKAVILLQKPSCVDIYGPLFYTLRIRNAETNYTKLLQGTENMYTFLELEPFSTYEVEIITSRYYENLKNSSLSKTVYYNFSTSPAVAPPVKNLDIYSKDSKSMSIRYDLPEKPLGVLTEIQVRYCCKVSFTKCKTNIRQIKQCKLWPNKYCVDLSGLIAYCNMDVHVSLKNRNTHTFGNETTAYVYTVDSVPGKPINITYKTNCEKEMDYCHLNVTWKHPYQQNSTIDYFNIILNQTDFKESYILSSHIHEVLKITNQNYSPSYSYKISYLPYNTNYKLLLQSANHKYKSDFAAVDIKTDDIRNYINQVPNYLYSTNSTLVFRLPQIDSRLLYSIVTVIVQDYDTTASVSKTFAKQLEEDSICNKFGNTWIVMSVRIATITQEIVIGDGTEKYYKYLNQTIFNKPLMPQTKYCVTFIFKNSYKGMEHQLVYYEKDLYTSQAQKEMYAHKNASAHFYVLLFLLLGIPLGFVGYRYWKNKRQRKNIMGQEENVYETLPFEEYDTNCVSNETYDKLVHM